MSENFFSGAHLNVVEGGKERVKSFENLEKEAMAYMLAYNSFVYCYRDRSKDIAELSKNLERATVAIRSNLFGGRGGSLMEQSSVIQLKADRCTEEEIDRSGMATKVNQLRAEISGNPISQQKKDILRDLLSEYLEIRSKCNEEIRKILLNSKDNAALSSAEAAN